VAQIGANAQRAKNDTYNAESDVTATRNAVISGTFTLGMGEVADRNNAKPLPAGSFFAFAPGMAHYAFTDEETVVQINSTGPWGINYVNPKDDPRQKTQ
jgi:hypothetical protein